MVPYLQKFRETDAEVNAELEFTKMTRKYSKYGTTVQKYSKITIIIVIFVQKCGRRQSVNQFLG